MICEQPPINDRCQNFYNSNFDIKHFLANNKVLVLPVCKVWFDLMETEKVQYHNREIKK